MSFVRGNMGHTAYPGRLRQKKMLSPEIMARMQRLADSAAVLKPIAARIQIHF